jgi:hypothetical protein
VKNRLTVTNIPKAWGILTTDGAGNVSVSAGFNISSVAINTNGVRVTFAQAFSSASYAVVLLGQVIGEGPYANNQTSSTIDLRLWTPNYAGAAHAVVNLGTTARTLYFVAYGAQ